ncbi:MAG: undecaprenyldiphospho-muramoylpentapeptide beta-N-acetylglucosaminyltransferase, partial [Calditrichota bacterium]
MNATKKTGRILIAGGGTGGHVYPALATIEALKESGDYDFLYVGGRGGIETRIVPKYNIPMQTIWISGFNRSLSLKNFLFPMKLLSSLYSSWKIVRAYKPQVAVGMGGYVTGPILYMASRMGVPVLIQEQDAHPGVTTRLLARYARKICLAFEQAKSHFSDYEKKLVVTGNPIRQMGALSREEGLKEWNLDPQNRTLFVFGGSQGSRAINTALNKLLPELLEDDSLQIIWQTGQGEYEAVKAGLSVQDERVVLLNYIENMPAAFAAADIIICRAGASSLAELAMAEKATILVPYPYAAGNHQELNSRMVEEAGA